MTIITRYLVLLLALTALGLSACSTETAGPLLGKLYVANYDKDRFPMFNADFIAEKKIREMIGSSPEAKQKEVFSFNKSGQITAHFMLEASDTLESERYFYNTAGKLMRLEKNSGSYKTKKSYFYDKEGRLKEVEAQLNYPNEIALSGRATLHAAIVYTYENGRCVSKADHKSEELDLYRYNDRDLITSILSTSLFKNTPDTLGLLNWRYDDIGRFSQLDMLFVNTRTNRFTVRMVPSYDAEGRLLRVSRYNSQPNEGLQRVGDFLFVYDMEGRLQRIQGQEAQGDLKVLQSFEYKYY